MHGHVTPSNAPAARKRAKTQHGSANSLLTEHKLRPTLARISILEMFQSGQALTPEQVYRQLVQEGGDVSLATTYRALGQFVDSGLLSRQQLDNGPGRYFLSQAKPDERMLCTECGALMPLPGADVAELLRQIAAKHGYQLTEYELALQGRCISCSRKAKAAKAANK